MNWLNYHHLYYFRKIVEHGSISKAAIELRIGQPTLSAQLKELEGRLGQLFERKAKSLILTERGKIVYKYAKEIFTRGDELLSVLERGELAFKRELFLGAQEGVPKTMIAEAIARLQKKMKVKIRVTEGDAPLLLDNLLEGKIDLVIFDHELTHTGGTIVYLPVGHEKIAFWGTEKFKDAAAGFPKSLGGLPMILSQTGHPLRQTVENFFIKHNLPLDIVVEAPDVALIKDLGRAGVGIIAVGDKTAKDWAQAGKFFKLGQLPYQQNYVLGLKKTFLKDPMAEMVVKEFER